jgi:hypothetical protein
LYFGLQRNLWFNLAGNIVVFVLGLLWAALSKTEITGRQTSMPPNCSLCCTTAT